MVACGAFHSAIVCTNGDLYTMGRGDCGQLGHGSSIEQQIKPKLVALNTNNKRVPIDVVACGFKHTICIGRLFVDSSKKKKNSVVQNHVYAFGWNAHHQLGITESSTQSRIFEPRLVDTVLYYHHETNTYQSKPIPAMKGVDCGHSHSLLMSKCGEAFAFGANNHGQLAIPKAHIANAKTIIPGVFPTRVEQLFGMFCESVSCGDHYSMAISSGFSTKSIYIWGSTNNRVFSSYNENKWQMNNADQSNLSISSALCRD
eukprot:CAMPEP_0201554798 /NCGR_PEP_ID=MMETSP0173_2-20130828/44276_1 /ASSEMBLY_ACC=CAM_ASM_000268 /TAXON_ID=218659 /ORGANISM="Vexillifera sp., Strain DIVA3 564/2" /LENGTH=257 /DNA_ID=CAMNT_0047966279 /DNA_START=387 /DNA_END=1157 /DNA_ORIENTATION=-